MTCLCVKFSKLSCVELRMLYDVKILGCLKDKDVHGGPIWVRGSL